MSLWLDGTLKLIAAASNSLINFQNVSNVTITGHGTLDGNGPAQTTVSPGIAVMMRPVIILKSLRRELIGQTRTCWNLNLTGCSNVRLDGVSLLGPATSANEFAAGCDDCWLVNSLVDGTGCGDYGFAFYGGVTNSGAIGNTIRNTSRIWQDLPHLE